METVSVGGDMSDVGVMNRLGWILSLCLLLGDPMTAVLRV